MFHDIPPGYRKKARARSMPLAVHNHVLIPGTTHLSTEDSMSRNVTVLLYTERFRASRKHFVHIPCQSPLRLLTSSSAARVFSLLPLHGRLLLLILLFALRLPLRFLALVLLVAEDILVAGIKRVTRRARPCPTLSLCLSLSLSRSLPFSRR